MKVCLGVSGGIAAYKSAELIRQLQQNGLEVQVVMTRHAREFLTPLTLASLSRAQSHHRPVRRVGRGSQHRERHRAHCRGAIH